jgi:Na+/H+ antiporter NhaC
LWAKTPRSGQAACFSVGIFIFFDDYANVLLAGGALRPLMDAVMISREKLSFLVDATAAPIASISPVSSWVGYEIGLIQEQIDRIVALQAAPGSTLAPLTIKTSGFGVFLQSIKYRYYPIFMIILMMALIYTGRDMGPMLVAERKTRVYRRTDGGPGRLKGPGGGHIEGSEGNEPRKDTPYFSWNMILPVLLLVRVCVCVVCAGTVFVRCVCVKVFLAFVCVGSFQPVRMSLSTHTLNPFFSFFW